MTANTLHFTGSTKKAALIVLSYFLSSKQKAATKKHAV